MEQLPTFECQIHNKEIQYICKTLTYKQKSRLLCRKCVSSYQSSNSDLVDIDDFLSDILIKQSQQTQQEKQIQELIGYKNQNFQNALKSIKIMLENYFELKKLEPSRENYQEHIQNLLQRDNQEFLLSVFSQQESNLDKKIKEQRELVSLKHDNITRRFQQFINDIDTQQDKKFAEQEDYYKKKISELEQKFGQCKLQLAQEQDKYKINQSRISELEQKLGQCKSQLAQETNKTNQSNQQIQQNQPRIPTGVQFSQKYKQDLITLSEGNQVAQCNDYVGSVFIEQPLNYDTSTYFEVKVEKLNGWVCVGIHSKLGDKEAIDDNNRIDYCYLKDGQIIKKGKAVDYGQKSKFKEGDTVGVYLNQSKGILKFYVNGTHNGAAVLEISLKQQTYYAVVFLQSYVSGGYSSVRFLGFKPCPNQ